MERKMFFAILMLLAVTCTPSAFLSELSYYEMMVVTVLSVCLVIQCYDLLGEKDIKHKLWIAICSARLCEILEEELHNGESNHEKLKKDYDVMKREYEEHKASVQNQVAELNEFRQRFGSPRRNAPTVAVSPMNQLTLQFPEIKFTPTPMTTRQRELFNSLRSQFSNVRYVASEVKEQRELAQETKVSRKERNFLTIDMDFLFLVFLNIVEQHHNPLSESIKKRKSVAELIYSRTTIRDWLLPCAHIEANKFNQDKDEKDKVRVFKESTYNKRFHNLYKQLRNLRLDPKELTTNLDELLFMKDDFYMSQYLFWEQYRGNEDTTTPIQSPM